MAKTLILDTQVKTDQIDKAVSKLGQLKDLGRGLKIQYDIDNKPLEVVIDKTKNLQEQFKLVTRELKRTKEGTAEFQLLAKTQGDIQDALGRTAAKSKDLFSSLSLLPGPIGQFFNQLQGTIELLKTFSSFTFKDVAFQFKEAAGDIADIAENLSDVTDNTGKIAGPTTSAVNGLAEATTAGAAATVASTVAVKSNTVATVDNIAAQEINTLSGRKLSAVIQATTTALGAVDATYKNNIVTMVLADGTTAQLTKSEILNQAATLGIVQANTAAAASTSIFTETLVALRAVLTSTFVVITSLVTAIGLIGFKTYQWVTATTAAEEAQKSIKEALKKGTEELGKAQNAVNEVRIAFELAAKGTITKKDALDTYNKVLGSSIGQAKTFKEAEDLYNANTGNYIRATGLRAEAQALFAVAATKSAEAIAAEQRGFFSFERGLFQNKTSELIERKNKLNETANLIREQGNKLLADALELESTFTPETKTPETKTPDTKKKEIDIKAANALLLKLQQENTVNILNEERKRQDAQLKIDKQNEEAQIQQLFEIEGKKVKLTVEQEKIKSDLLEQVRVKYGLKVIDLNKKRQEEDNKTFDDDQKKLKEYQDKIFEITNNADENEFSRNKAARTKKFEDDKAALEKDTNFQKQSLEEKIRILLALEKEYNREIEKIDADEVASKEETNQKLRDKNIKKLEDELKFLQIRGEALREGTKSFFNNQRDILKAAEKKELADLEDKAIKEKLTIEQIEKEKLAIKEKYLKAAKDITNQELEQILQAAQATLGVAQSIAQDIGKVAQLEQQVALEEAKKRYIAQNELDKKTITNAEQQEAKLLENKKKFAKEEDDIKRKAFEENKKIQIAQAIIATLQSAVGAFSSLIATPFVGPVIAPIAAAAALVFGYKQVAAIKKTQYQSPIELSESETVTVPKSNPGRNYEKGGMIGGRRHAEGGTLIEAEKGEAIMTRGSVATFGPLLSLMNQAGGGVSFNSNLMTTRQDNPIVNNPAQEQAPLIVKTYVVSQELTTEAQRQARLKNLSTI
jgi:hypothetical protein